MKKGVIVGIIIAVAIGITFVSVFSTDLAKDEMIPNIQSETENTQSEFTQQEGGRQLSVELSEDLGLKSP